MFEKEVKFKKDRENMFQAAVLPKIILSRQIVTATNDGIYKRVIKRTMDVVLSLCAIIFFSPLLLLEALLVRITLDSPVLFKQKRPGIKEKIFELYKFRTMTDKCDEFGELLSNKKRTTKFGSFLRSTSLDELPELWNILIGDMSFVGPRPQLVKDMVFMSRVQRLRHTVLPGLTGFAQINGRNNSLWNERLNFDVAYIKNINFIGDMKIIFQTILNVFKRDCITIEKLAIVEDLGDYLLRVGTIDKKLYKIGIKDSQDIINSTIPVPKRKLIHHTDKVIYLPSRVSLAS